MKDFDMLDMPIIEILNTFCLREPGFLRRSLMPYDDLLRTIWHLRTYNWDTINQPYVFYDRECPSCCLWCLFVWRCLRLTKWRIHRV